MFKSSNPQVEFNGVIDAGSHVNGELHFETMFRIEGKLTGTIVSPGVLTVGEQGEVDGEIRVRQRFVAGTVKGSLRASERIEIASTGRVMADLFTPSLTLEDGAYFEGRCTMRGHPGAPSTQDEGERSGEERPKVTPMPIAKG